MSDNSTISFGEVQSVMKNELDEVVRKAALSMISKAIEFELADFMKLHSFLTYCRRSQGSS
jgi:hypothetical protein